MSAALREPVPGAIWASLPVPALVIDARGCILDANPAAEEFLNAARRSLIGAPALDRLAVDAPMEEALARVRASHAPLFINDVDVGTGERAPMQCNIQLAPMGDDPDTILALVAPREMAGRLNRGPAARTASRSAIGMAELLAHEIKNPLAGIAGAAQLLSMNLDESDREFTDLIVAETRRVVKLLEQVEQFGNLRKPEPRAVNIHDVLERARRTAQLGFAARMRIVEEYDPSLPAALADADQLTQVVLNLLKNAAAAAGEAGGTIRLRSFYDQALRVRRTDGAGGKVPLQIEVIDDGPGLPEEIAEEIFEPFVSGRENGTGLGLALVSRIMAEHGGWVAAESVPGQTVFRLSLPVAPPETPPAPAEAEPTEDC